MATWNAKVVRIATNQCFWLADTAGTGYRQTLAQAVTWAEQAGLYVILDLHWSNPPENPNQATSGCAQQVMADTNSVTFWQQVATAYASDPKVIFELYNEPFIGSSGPSAADWILWQNGGSFDASAATSQSNAYTGTFQVVGMQALYNAVRGTGAPNLVIIGGLNWAYDLSGVTLYPINGTNIAYATHPYSNKAGTSNYTTGGPAPSDWDQKFGNLARSYPVIATEFGNSDCSTPYYNVFTTYAASKGISWTAWAWYYGGWADPNSGAACGFPTILADWNGDPSNVGQIIKSAM
jgi:aryl-phospho-beta-D-glucosidase BglC (GH1 family)